MDAIVKEFDESNVVPFHMTFHHTKTKYEELPHHLHEWHEVFLVHKGKSRFFIDDLFYDLEPGDIVIIPSNVIHCTQPADGALFTSSALFFCPSILTGNSDVLTDLFSSSKLQRKHRYHLSEEKQSEFLELLNKLNRETSTSDRFTGEMSIILIQAIVIFLSRHCHTTANETAGMPDWIHHSLHYINNHLDEEIELTQLASAACVHPAYFSKRFKTTIGLTFSDFIKSKRMIKAKELLRNTSCSVQDIAEQCGYKSMPHFFRTFRATTGKTPSVYRKMSLN
ncbi:AraC family transcriptional regulator [Geomicrobium sp. JCM 19038]|uniref:AraC family transcriptional regulator n=1 Tax=Geomicrobium sp. JCM 19038 TaxID=1460635 RepID=UPI00045F45E5|nr:AraC family transcriptional regulator [Geomicrobium sp. JCM 19038]GAK06777.1 transcriptional regulator, AraC family [Geomicrobium sp. JCM 19038]